MVIPNDHALVAYLVYFLAFAKDPERVWHPKEEGGRWYIYDDHGTMIAGRLHPKMATTLMTLSRAVEDDTFVKALEGALENGDPEVAYTLITEFMSQDAG